jgi:hypothetical protein
MNYRLCRRAHTFKSNSACFKRRSRKPIEKANPITVCLIESADFGRIIGFLQLVSNAIGRCENPSDMGRTRFPFRFSVAITRPVNNSRK